MHSVYVGVDLNGLYFFFFNILAPFTGEPIRLTALNDSIVNGDSSPFVLVGIILLLLSALS